MMSYYIFNQFTATSYKEKLEFLQNVNPRRERTLIQKKKNFAVSNLKIVISFCHCCLVSIKLRSAHSCSKFQIIAFCSHSTVGKILKDPYQIEMMPC